jgi:hypothetical protein
MRLLIIVFLTLLFLNLYGHKVYGQKKNYANQCILVRDLIDTADKTFFNFQKIFPDSSITILDINNILTECLIDSLAKVKVKVVNSGEDVERIKKEGIFSSPKNRKDLFVFTKEQLDNLTGYRIFHPRSNGSCYWGFNRKNNRYYFSKKSFGWF